MGLSSRAQNHQRALSGSTKLDKPQSVTVINRVPSVDHWVAQFDWKIILFWDIFAKFQVMLTVLSSLTSVLYSIIFVQQNYTLKVDPWTSLITQLVCIQAHLACTQPLSAFMQIRTDITVPHFWNAWEPPWKKSELKENRTETNGLKGAKIGITRKGSRLSTKQSQQILS